MDLFPDNFWELQNVEFCTEYPGPLKCCSSVPVLQTTWLDDVKLSKVAASTSGCWRRWQKFRENWKKRSTFFVERRDVFINVGLNRMVSSPNAMIWSKYHDTGTYLQMILAIIRQLHHHHSWCLSVGLDNMSREISSFEEAAFVDSGVDKGRHTDFMRADWTVPLPCTIWRNVHHRRRTHIYWRQWSRVGMWHCSLCMVLHHRYVLPMDPSFSIFFCIHQVRNFPYCKGVATNAGDV